jgi:hypothetical protein
MLKLAFAPHYVYSKSWMTLSVKVSECGATPKDLLESELFAYLA